MPELSRNPIAEVCRADLGNGKPAGGDDERIGREPALRCTHFKAAGPGDLRCSGHPGQHPALLETLPGPPEDSHSAQQQVLLAPGREKQRARQEEDRKFDEQAKEDERKRTEADGRRNAFQKLAEWYQAEQQTIRQLLPDGFDQDDALRVLFDRYDKLMKETYAEMKP